MQQYYGPKEILSKVEENGFVTMTLKRDDSEEKFTMKVPTIVFEKVVSNEEKDWNYVQETKFNAVNHELIEVLQKHGITGGEVKTLASTLVVTYFNIINRAISYQFMGEDDSFVPSSDMYFDFTLERAHEITKHLDESADTTTDTPA